MAAVISDASVLISLASADHLDLLRKLYGTVLIPSVVAWNASRMLAARYKLAARSANG